MKKALLLTLAVILVLSFVSYSFAGDRSLKEDAKTAGKAAANYTGNVVTGSVNTVGEATKETTETAVSPIVALWRSITGKGKPKEIVTDPVNKGGEAVYNATVNTGNTVAGKKK